ncbi:MAG: UDP-glucose/GDP-mannose dehydrogenase family protein [Rhizobiales bacterium]|nr:UDP-glucose/GDP-mannose dehydrogenase family protein [Hyphomicrobiales bacterium]
MRVAMIGAGYVGLVSGACLADFGHTVSCIDKDRARIAALNRGEIPIYEPGLQDLVTANMRQGRLSFAADLTEAVRGADVVFIAVGTPSRRGEGGADLSFAYQAARDIAAALERYTVVATKSTVPVGTGDEVERIIREARPDADMSVVSNPEFLREGAAISDFKRPARIIVGTEDERAAAVMRELYRPLCHDHAPLVVVSRRTAELSKYAANAFLATKVTFINEIADLCERVGADVQDVARSIGLDDRIGARYLDAGPGYGGSCFPKDTLALIRTAREHGAASRIVETVVAVNDERRLAMARKVVAACGGEVRDKRVAVLGLTFKPNTDDIREAPSIAVVSALQEAGARLRAYDPEGMAQARLVLPDVDYADDAYACAEGADVLVIMTEWDAFRTLDLERLGRLMRHLVLVDLRNIYRPDEARRHGFTYVGIGRPGLDHSPEARDLKAATR